MLVEKHTNSMNETNDNAFVFFYTILGFISVAKYNIIHLAVDAISTNEWLAVVIKISLILTFWYKFNRHLKKTFNWWKIKIQALKRYFKQ